MFNCFMKWANVLMHTLPFVIKDDDKCFMVYLFCENKTSTVVKSPLGVRSYTGVYLLLKKFHFMQPWQSYTHAENFV